LKNSALGIGGARENLMLQRLGFSGKDIDKFYEECKNVEDLT